MISNFVNIGGKKKYLVGANYSIPAKRYNTYRAGGIIHMQPDDRVNYSRYDIESYLTQNYDWASLASQIADIGYIDFILFRVKLEDGFHYWPTETQFNNGSSFSYNGETVPIYGFDYHIGNSHFSGLGITSNMVEGFITAFEAVGIVPGLYYPIGRDRSTRTDMSNSELQNSATAAIYNKYDVFHQQVLDEIEELMRWYNPSMIWLDSMTKHPWLNNSGENVRWENHQEIYDLIKGINKYCIVNGNLNVSGDGGSLYDATDSTKIQFFPQDVISQEYNGEVSDPEYVDQMSHDGSNYLIPKERLWDGIYNNSQSIQYVWWDTNSPDAPAGANQIRTQQNYQDLYDETISLGATPLWNFAPYPASIGSNIHQIDSTILSRMQNISL